jgi:hypothetical protein
LKCGSELYKDETMNFPLSVSDIGLWLAVTAIIVLTTSELLSSSTGYSRNIVIERAHLRLIALGLGIGFMITVVLRVFQPI